jgi:hypothetical protein
MLSPFSSSIKVATFLTPWNIIFLQELASLTDAKDTPSWYGTYDVQYLVHKSLLLDSTVRQQCSSCLYTDCVQEQPKSIDL